jgi:hypothetical protein
MSLDILIAEIAGCGVMKSPLHSVTSYAFHENFFVEVGMGWGSCQCAPGGLFLY